MGLANEKAGRDKSSMLLEKGKMAGGCRGGSRPREAGERRWFIRMEREGREEGETKGRAAKDRGRR